MQCVEIRTIIRFDSDPVLTWMMSNVIARHHSNKAITPGKESSEKKIDDVLAVRQESKDSPQMVRFL